MNPFSRNSSQHRGFLSALLATVLLSSSAFAWQQRTAATLAPTRKPAATLTATEKKAAARRSA